MPNFSSARFNEFIYSLNLRYFQPYEFLIMGGRHSDPHSPCNGKNTPPPENLWPNIVRTAQILDLLRGRMGHPIRITNAYRSAAYNRCIGGARRSQHLRFNALDFVVEGGSRPSHWARALRSIRDDEDEFKGGVGLYNTFVHFDTRGTNADW
jgi:hypothetical protein